MPGRAGDVQRGGARHLVGAAGHQRVEGQRRVEPAARRQRAPRRHRRRRGDAASCRCLAPAAVRARRKRRAARPRRRRPARRRRALRRRARRRAAPSVTSRRTGLPASSLSTVSIRPAYWLRIQSSLKRFGHAHRDHRAGVAVVGDLGVGQRPDPGVELLVGQFGRRAFAAALPEVGSHVWRSALRKRRDCMSPQARRSASYPQGKTRCRSASSVRRAMPCAG